MSNDIGGQETIVRRRATVGTEGRFGDPGIPGTPLYLTLEGCIVFPRYATEAEGRQSTTIVGYTALAPDPDADVVASDVIEWRGRDYEIDGFPGQWRFMDSEDAALEIALKRAAN